MAGDDDDGGGFMRVSWRSSKVVDNGGVKEGGRATTAASRGLHGTVVTWSTMEVPRRVAVGGS